MPTFANTAVHAPPPRQTLGGGFGVAVALHVLVAAAIVGSALLHPHERNTFGDNTTRQGAVQATMVDSLPLPQRVPPVDRQVLTPDNPSVAPAPPPKEATQPPPRPTDVLVKARTPVKTPPVKQAPIEAPAPPKHPQPTPVTPKATTGESAAQLAMSSTQVRNGTAAATVEDRAFGLRYAYYRDIISRTVAQNWFTGEVDPSSNGKTATLVFDVERDGSIANIRTAKRSGSPSLDASALRALQRVDPGFGPLPGPADHVTVEYSFEYRQQ